MKMFVFAGKTRTCTICGETQTLTVQADRQYECMDACAGFRKPMQVRLADGLPRRYYECVETCEAPQVVRPDGAETPFCEADCGGLFVEANSSAAGVENSLVCVGRCASGFVSGNECVSGCASFWDPADARGHKLCRDTCPGNHTGEGMCVSACPADYFYLRAERACYRACPEGYADNAGTGTCELVVCPAERPFRELDGTCAAFCASRLFKTSVKAGVESRVCILRCSFYTIIQSVNWVQMSLCAEDFSCPEAGARLLDVASGTCVAKCPDNAFLLEETRVCVGSCPYPYYRDGVENKICMGGCEAPYGRAGAVSGGVTRCESNCASGELIFEGKCVTACPEGTFRADYFCNRTCTGSRRYELGAACEFACPRFTVQKPLENDECPAGAESSAGLDDSDAESARWVCVDACPYLWRENADRQRECVEACEDTEYYDLKTGECQANCPSGVTMGRACLETAEKCPRSVADGNFTRCYCAVGELQNDAECMAPPAACPANKPYIQEGSCVRACGSEYYYYRLSGEVGFVFGSEDNFQCVSACPAFRRFVQGRECVAGCESTIYEVVGAALRCLTKC